MLSLPKQFRLFRTFTLLLLSDEWIGGIAPNFGPKMSLLEMIQTLFVYRLVFANALDDCG
jgi:hypothetical protein